MAVGVGPLEVVLCDEVLSRAYDMPITVEWRDGRAWARKTRAGHGTEGAAPDGSRTPLG